MSILIAALIAFAVLVASAFVLSVSKSHTLDTVLYIVIYSVAAVSVTAAVVALISGLS